MSKLSPIAQSGCITAVFRFESKDRIGRTVAGFYLLSTNEFEGAEMREIIRFAWGIGSLGDFMVAMSDRGLVALEFSSHHSAMEETCRIVARRDREPLRDNDRRCDLFPRRENYVGG